MSLHDIYTQFQEEVIGTDLKIEKVTMRYSDGGNIQTFSFRIKKGRGATTMIDVESRDYLDIPIVVKKAAEKAMEWSSANE